MLIPEGYIPAEKLYNLVVGFIRTRVFEDDSDIPEDSVFRSNVLMNTRAAGEQLCYKMHQEFCGLFYVFSPASGAIPLHRPRYRPAPCHSLHHPPYFWNYNTAPEGQEPRFARLNWKDAIKKDFWLETIRSWDNESENRTELGERLRPISTVSISGYLQRIPYVDFKNGMLDLSELRLALELIETGLAFFKATELAKISLPKNLEMELRRQNHSKLDEIRARIEALQPFEAFPIILKSENFEEVREAFEEVSGNTEQYIGTHSDLSQRSPVSEILTIKSTDDTRSKKSVYRDLGGVDRMSWRRFLLYWDQAREINPEIGQPGRKRNN